MITSLAYFCMRILYILLYSYAACLASGTCYMSSEQQIVFVQGIHLAKQSVIIGEPLTKYNVLGKKIICFLQ